MRNDCGSANISHGVFGLLTLVCITLKLTGHIAWGWAWVLAPLWMPVVIMGMVLVGYAIVMTDKNGA